jgi:hypothetical protein
MASYPAIAATSEAILGLLEAAAADTEFSGRRFALYNATDLQTPMKNGVSLWLYRVAVATTRRNLGPRTGDDGRRYRPSLPLDLHYLLTAWAQDPATQQRLLGWCIRTLEDQPVLPSGLLNHYGPEPDVFRPHESVELVAEALSPADVSDVWEVSPKHREPSMAYLARAVEIDSQVELAEFPAVQTREFAYAEESQA